MKTSSMTVAARLSAGFGLVLSLMLVLIVVNIMRLATIGEINSRIIEKDWVKADAANIINATTRANARRTMELLITDDPAQLSTTRASIDVNKKIIGEALNTLHQLIYLPEGKSLLEKIQQARVNYVASFSKVDTLLKEEKKQLATQTMRTETLPALDALQEPITALSDLQKKIAVESGAQARETIDTARSLLLILGSLAVLAGITAAIVITRGLLKQLGGEPDYAAAIAGKIASGDLSVAIDIKSNDQSSLLFAIKSMRDSLANIVSRVRVGTDTIATASGQIAAGNLDLSSRTEEQASALEETASSMEQLTSTVKQNADNARQVNQLAVSASNVAVKGGDVVAQVVDTMGSINQSANKIVDIISVIDGIAFQTNILALNAAVEAARAGEQGRGFAVVASEVRTLAQRSAIAAKEIKILIGDSVEKVSVGSELVNQAGATMGEIVASVKRMTDIMGEITSASREQEAGIEQINQAITEMDTVTQQNAALVEQAAAAEALRDQAASLAQVAGIFQLDGVPANNPRGSAVATRRDAPTNTAALSKRPAQITSGRAVNSVRLMQPASQPLVSNADWDEF